MKHHGSQRSFWRPVIVVFVIALLSYLIYYGSRRIGNPSLHEFLATTFGTIYFLSIFFGPFFIFTANYLQGVSLGKRILSAAAIPFLWMTKDVILSLQSHPFIECLYWYLNPLTIWLICLITIEMGLGTIVGRILLRRRGQSIKVITTGPIVAILIAAVAFGGIYAWGQGENLFSIYLDGYRLLFGSGT